jgi:hypothetical protein
MSAGGDGVAEDLFGRHVGGRAHHRAGRGDAGRIEGLGDAEVADQRAIGAKEDVRRLQVAVGHPAGVHVAERLGEPDRHIDDLGRRERAHRDPVRQRRALDQPHREECKSIVGAGVVERDQARMLQRTEDLDLLEASTFFDGERAGIEELARMEQFDGDFSVVVAVVGAKDASSRAAAEEFTDLVRFLITSGRGSASC